MYCQGCLAKETITLLVVLYTDTYNLENDLKYLGNMKTCKPLGPAILLLSTYQRCTEYFDQP